MAMTCTQCGEKAGPLAFLTMDLAADKYVSPDCAEKRLREIAREASQRSREDRTTAAKIKAAAANVILTTTPHVDGYRVLRYLGIESVEFVIGTGMFSEISSSIADFFGARSSVFEQKLQQAKQHAMGKLKYLAAEKGANAVIGVDLDYTEFNGNRIGLIINGTLVEIAPYG